MIESKHFKKGSEMPTFPDDGKIRLFSMRFCPYAHRAHLVLDAKNIPYHVINCDLKEKPEWLAKVSPFTKVPAIELQDLPGKPSIYESLIIAEYLDERYPQNPLYPKDLLARIQEKLWIERFSTVSTPFVRVAYKGVSESPGALTEIANGLDLFEGELKRRDTKFFGGGKPGILDYMIWPWCERIDALKYMIGDQYKMDKSRYPKLIEWRSDMQEDPAVKVTYLPPDIHAKWLTERPGGYPNYDLLVNEAKRPRLE